MHIKRYLLASVAFFVFIFIYEMILHGFLLSPIYETTAHIWRSLAEMQGNIPKGIAFQIGLAFWTTFAFSQMYKEGGVSNGLKFGLFFGGFAAILTSNWYLWLPVSSLLGIYWFIIGLGKGLIGGLIIGSIYHQQ